MKLIKRTTHEEYSHIYADAGRGIAWHGEYRDGTLSTQWFTAKRWPSKKFFFYNRLALDEIKFAHWSEVDCTVLKPVTVSKPLEFTDFDSLACYNGPSDGYSYIATSGYPISPIWVVSAPTFNNGNYDLTRLLNHVSSLDAQDVFVRTLHLHDIPSHYRMEATQQLTFSLRFSDSKFAALCDEYGADYLSELTHNYGIDPLGFYNFRLQE